MFNDQLLAGRRILVTGGGTGLGKSMAARFLQLGAEVHICGRRKIVCDETATELMDQYGGRVVSHGVDIRNAMAVDEMIEPIWTDGPLTDLINNAAGNFISRTEDLSPRGFDAVANIVMHGTFYVTHAVGRRWIAAKQRGNVVSITVTWVRNGSPYVVPSAMSKSAIHAMTMSLATEWGKHGIRLNTIAPGEIPTEGMSKRIKPGDEAGARTTGAEPDGPRRHHGGAAEPRRVPDLRRLRLDQRRDHRHGRRAGARHGRQFLPAARLERRRLEEGARTRSRRRTRRTARRGGNAVVPANAGTHNHRRSFCEDN